MAICLYVIAESVAGPCKIGIGDSPEKRLASLQCGNPRRLTLHHARSIAHHLPHAVEQLAHALAGEAHRLSGEWFSLSVADAVTAVDLAIERQRSIVVSEYPIDPTRAKVVMMGGKRRLKPPSELYRQRRAACLETSAEDCSAPTDAGSPYAVPSPSAA